MKTLACPECHQVMHRVEKITPRTEQAGISQLSRHCTMLHVVPQMEAMLEGVASMNLPLDHVLGVTEITCANCGILLDHETFLYVRKYGRTIQCCSTSCQEDAR
jgi:hypothetical protein